MPDENLLIFVGRINKYKNLDFVVRAFRLAIDDGFVGKLLLVGDGPQSKGLKKLAQKLGIEDKVIFTGQIRDRDLLKSYYASADLFVMASLFDNDPMTVVEAASVGVPSLTIENAGCSSRIENGVNGYTCELTLQGFANGIINAFANKSALSKAGQKAITMTPSTWQEAAVEYTQIYTNLIKKR